jgi:SAM-dependent methyltransferase
MGLISTITKATHFRYKHLKKVNEYYLDQKGLFKFETEIHRRLEGQAIELAIDSYFVSPHNPLAHCISVPRWIAERYKLALKYIDQYRPNSILETGCGFGVSTWFMSDAAEQVIGLDISATGIKVARALFPETEYVLSDAAQFFEDNPDCYFDVIVDCYGAFDHKLAIKYKKHFGKLIKIGLRPKKSEVSFKQYLNWEHKLPGYHLGFNCTLYDGEKQGISPGYPLSYFSWSYLHELMHSIQHKSVYVPF